MLARAGPAAADVSEYVLLPLNERWLACVTSVTPSGWTASYGTDHTFPNNRICHVPATARHSVTILRAGQPETTHQRPGGMLPFSARPKWLNS